MAGALASVFIVFLVALRPRVAPPNIVLITLDTTRADHIGAYGDTRAQTPILDRLAASGVLFERAVTVAPTTLPAHASLLTGTYPFTHGVRNNGNFTLGGTLPTLATATHDAGYRTAAFVSAFVLDRRYGLARGFDVYDDRFDLERRGDATVHAAGDWLAQGANDPRPFFLWVHLYDPHDPYDPPQAIRRAFADRPYDGEIAFADQAIGALLERLRVLPSFERTVIAVAGDHGESLGEHQEATHGIFVYDAVMRVPMIVAAPGAIRPGTRVAALVRTIDLAPTLAARANLVLRGADGRDLGDLIREPRNAALGPGEAYGETYFPRLFMNWSELRSIRDERWKYIEAPAPELYDLAADPQEHVNVASREPAKAAALARALQAATAGRQTAVTPQLVDRETARKLAALGYIGGAVDTPSSEQVKQLQGTQSTQSTQSNSRSAVSAVSAVALVRRDPKDMIGVFNRLRDANAAIRQARFADAEAVALAVLKEDESNAFARMVAGRAQLELGRYVDAAASYRAYAALVPASADAHHWMAVCYSRLGDVDLALAEDDIALSLDPRHAEAHALRGGLLAARGQIDRAAADLKAAVDLLPDNAGFRVGLARILVAARRFDEAEAEIRRVLNNQPNHPDAHAAQASLLVARGQLEPAIAEFERALAIRAEADDVRLDLARTLDRLGRRQEARRHAAALLEGRETPAEIREEARRLLAK